MSAAVAPLGARITVLAPAFYVNPAYSTRYLRISAERCGVPVRWYGAGEPYRGWLDVQLVHLIEELKRVTTSHVLYTDSSDSIFLSDLNEVWAKYVLMGEPEILLSVERDGGICAGGWMGRRLDAIDVLEWLFDAYEDSNPQERWREFYKHEGEGFGIQLDTERRIFQVADEPLEIVMGNKRVRSSHGTLPCVLHWAGGYTDPHVGKAALIEPAWKQLGYEPTVGYEAHIE